MANWWEGYPWRMVQTNLRETDMADMEPERFAASLRDFGATLVTLNAAGLIASYDSALPFQGKSRYAEGYDLAAVIAACHRAGIKVIARLDFSKISREIYERHPDWAFVDEKGQIYEAGGYVQACLNGAYQQERAFDILEEVLSRFDFDGMFCNMSGFMVVDYDCKYRGPCHCAACREKYHAATGEELPGMREMASGKAGKYMAFGSRCASELKGRIYRRAKELKPGLAVNGFDYVRNEVNTDLGRPQWLYAPSSNARLAAGPERRVPADTACADFVSFKYRQVCVSPALTSLRMWQSLANGGSVSHFTMGRLDDHRDRDSMERAREVFAFHAAHPEVWQGLSSAAQALLIHSGNAHRLSDEARGWIQALTECHVPFDELPQSGIERACSLPGRRAVILCDVRTLTPGQCEALDAFAASGGAVISADGAGLGQLACLGAGKPQERRKLSSGMLELKEDDALLLPSCCGAPYIAPGGELIVAPHSAVELLRLIPDHPYGPPESCYFTEKGTEPGLLVNVYGLGSGISLLFGAGALYCREGWQNTLNVMRDTLFSLAGLPELAPGLPASVELTLCRRGEETVIQLVNASGVARGAWHSPIPVRDIAIHLHEGGFTSVRALNGGRARLVCSGEETVLELDRLGEYEALVLT